MLFILGFLSIFVIGGLTGVMVASVPYDWQVHDTVERSTELGAFQVALCTFILKL